MRRIVDSLKCSSMFAAIGHCMTCSLAGSPEAALAHAFIVAAGIPCISMYSVGQTKRWRLKSRGNKPPAWRHMTTVLRQVDQVANGLFAGDPQALLQMHPSAQWDVQGPRPRLAVSNSVHLLPPRLILAAGSHPLPFVLPGLLRAGHQVDRARGVHAPGKKLLENLRGVGKHAVVPVSGRWWVARSHEVEATYLLQQHIVTSLP